MKRFLICLLSMNLLLAVPASAASYNWQKISQYGQTEWMCYKDNTALYGWNYINGNWYYFYSDGIMAHDTFVDGYYINSDGAWSNDIPYVVQRILDVIPNSSWIYTVGNNYDTGIFTVENQNLKQLCRYGWNAPDVNGTVVCIGEGGYEYFVSDNGTVYQNPHQAYDSLYEYDNNGNIVNEYKYIGND